jgi:hypothetical protein
MHHLPKVQITMASQNNVTAKGVNPRSRPNKAWGLIGKIGLSKTGALFALGLAIIAAVIVYMIMGSLANAFLILVFTFVMLAVSDYAGNPRSGRSRFYKTH